MNQTAWLELHLIPGQGISADALALAYHRATGQCLTFLGRAAHALAGVDLTVTLARLPEEWLDIALTMRRGGATPEALLEILRAVPHPPRDFAVHDFALAGGHVLLRGIALREAVMVSGVKRTPAQIAWKLSRGEWPTYIRFKDGNPGNLSPGNLSNARRIRRVAQHLPAGVTYDAKAGRYRVRKLGRSFGYYWTRADACAALTAACHAS